jgi:hypothetical protein
MTDLEIGLMALCVLFIFIASTVWYLSMGGKE